MQATSSVFTSCSMLGFDSAPAYASSPSPTLVPGILASPTLVPGILASPTLVPGILASPPSQAELCWLCHNSPSFSVTHIGSRVQWRDFVPHLAHCPLRVLHPRWRTLHFLDHMSYYLLNRQIQLASIFSVKKESPGQLAESKSFQPEQNISPQEVLSSYVFSEKIDGEIHHIPSMHSLFDIASIFKLQKRRASLHSQTINRCSAQEPLFSDMDGEALHSRTINRCSAQEPLFSDTDGEVVYSLRVSEAEGLIVSQARAETLHFLAYIRSILDPEMHRTYVRYNANRCDKSPKTYSLSEETQSTTQSKRATEEYTALIEAAVNEMK